MNSTVSPWSIVDCPLRKFLLWMMVYGLLTILIASNSYAELRNNMDADVVIGQRDFTSGGINQGLGTGSCRANTLYQADYAYSDGTRLFVNDRDNNRVLIFNKNKWSRWPFNDIGETRKNFPCIFLDLLLKFS